MIPLAIMIIYTMRFKVRLLIISKNREPTEEPMQAPIIPTKHQIQVSSQ